MAAQTVAIETISEQRCFGGTQGFYRHESKACGGPMNFAVYTPPQAAKGKVPVLFYLAGLTCTAETFPIKAGAQRVAAELGLMLVSPDTSPRDTGIEGATDDWQFGEGAGFYVDATQAPWSARFRMETHTVEELPALIAAHFPADLQRCGIMGHSMGGHGALTLALRHPGRYRSLSAMSPIAAPTRVPWGERRIFIMYLGADREEWKRHDASELVRSGARFDGTILIDQGEEDPYLAEQLRPELFERACRDTGQSLTLRMQPGYDHSYWFVQSFIEDHLRHHARELTEQTTAETTLLVRSAQTGDEPLISRSQAKNLIQSADQFQHVTLDFQSVTTIGPAFADEIFRVFAQQHSEVELAAIHAVPEVQQMIRRAQVARDAQPNQ